MTSDLPNPLPVPASYQDWDILTIAIKLLRPHLHLRRMMEVDDIYKLFYQGIVGPQHLLRAADPGASELELKVRLGAEFKALDPLTRRPRVPDPLIEPVHPAGLLVRVNLAPYKARGGDLESLTSAFLRTASRCWGALADVRSVWGMFIDLNRRNFRPSPGLQALLDFTREIEALGFLAVHHSSAYVAAYLPSYRVVAAEYLDWIPLEPGDLSPGLWSDWDFPPEPRNRVSPGNSVS
jgi:hypothetical protein